MTTLITRNLFPKDVISAGQPEACRIRDFLAGLAKARHARLVGFCVAEGEVRFEFDNDRAAYQISEDIMDTIGIRPVIRRPAGGREDIIKRRKR